MRKNKSFDEYSMEMANMRSTLCEMKEHITKALELARNIKLIDCDKYHRWLMEYIKKEQELVISNITYIYRGNVSNFTDSKRKKDERLAKFLIKEFKKHQEDKVELDEDLPF